MVLVLVLVDALMVFSVPTVVSCFVNYGFVGAAPWLQNAMLGQR
jgi:hypothetical protein